MSFMSPAGFYYGVRDDDDDDSQPSEASSLEGPNLLSRLLPSSLAADTRQQHQQGSHTSFLDYSRDDESHHANQEQLDSSLDTEEDDDKQPTSLFCPTSLALYACFPPSKSSQSQQHQQIDYDAVDENPFDVTSSDDDEQSEPVVSDDYYQLLTTDDEAESERQGGVLLHSTTNPAAATRETMLRLSPSNALADGSLANHHYMTERHSTALPIHVVDTTPDVIGKTSSQNFLATTPLTQSRKSLGKVIDYDFSPEMTPNADKAAPRTSPPLSAHAIDARPKEIMVITTPLIQRHELLTVATALVRRNNGRTLDQNDNDDDCGSRGVVVSKALILDHVQRRRILSSSCEYHDHDALSARTCRREMLCRLGLDDSTTRALLQSLDTALGDLGPLSHGDGAAKIPLVPLTKDIFVPHYDAYVARAVHAFSRELLPQGRVNAVWKDRMMS